MFQKCNLPVNTLLCTLFIHAELRALLSHITGAEIARKRTIKVDFFQDVNGTICAHTCGNQIGYPRGVFVEGEESYASFEMAMRTVV